MANGCARKLGPIVHKLIC